MVPANTSTLLGTTWLNKCAGKTTQLKKNVLQNGLCRKMCGITDLLNGMYITVFDNNLGQTEFNLWSTAIKILLNGHQKAQFSSIEVHGS